MKIIINATNQIEDRPLREVERLINSGKAHLPEAGGVIPPITEIPIYNDQILNLKQMEALKNYKEEKKTDEEVIFREPSLKEEIKQEIKEEIKIDKLISKTKKKK